MLAKLTAYSLTTAGLATGLMAQLSEPTWDKLTAAAILATFIGLWLGGRLLTSGEHSAQVAQWKERYQEQKERADKWERLCIEGWHNSRVAERTTEKAVGVAEQLLPPVLPHESNPKNRGRGQHDERQSGQ